MPGFNHDDDSRNHDDPVAAERQRISSIDAAARGLELTGQYGERAEQLRAKAIDEGWSENEFKAAALDLVRTARPVVSNVSNHRAPDTAERDVLTAGVLRLLGQSEVAAKAFGEHAAQAADDLRCNSLMDLAAHAVRQSQGFVPQGKSELLKAAFSTTTLAVAVGSAAEKVALTAFRESPRTWEPIARQVSAANFREHTGIRLAAATALEQLAPDGEIQHGSLAEETSTFKVDTFARMLSVTRQDLINDDLGVLSEIPQAFARAAARKVSDLAYTVLLANAGSFFGSAHGNLLTGTGSALSVSALGDAVKALRNQVDADGMPVDITPRSLLVPPSLEGTAREVLNSVEIARNTSSTDRLPTGNPWRDSLGLQVEPRLESSAFTGSSATAWYVFGSSQDGALLVAGLNGQLAPRIEQADTDFNRLGVQWRCYLDAGAALGDWRAAVKAAGA